MGNPPFEDVSPDKNGGFPLLFTRGYLFLCDVDETAILHQLFLFQNGPPRQRNGIMNDVHYFPFFE